MSGTVRAISPYSTADRAATDMLESVSALLKLVQPQHPALLNAYAELHNALSRAFDVSADIIDAQAQADWDAYTENALELLAESAETTADA